MSWAFCPAMLLHSCSHHLLGNAALLVSASPFFQWSRLFLVLLQENVCDWLVLFRSRRSCPWQDHETTQHLREIDPYKVDDFCFWHSYRNHRLYCSGCHTLLYHIVCSYPVYTWKWWTYPVWESARVQSLNPRLIGLDLSYCFEECLPFKV